MSFVSNMQLLITVIQILCYVAGYAPPQPLNMPQQETIHLPPSTSYPAQQMPNYGKSTGTVSDREAVQLVAFVPVSISE